MTVSAALSIVLLLGAGSWKVYETMHPQSGTFGNVSTHTNTNDTSDVVAQLLTAAAAQGSAASLNAAISQIGPAVITTLASDYFAMKQQGNYTPEAAQKVAATLVPSLQAQIAYNAYNAADVKTDSNTSFARMMTYRTDLQKSLAPLLKNKEYELTTYGKYVETQDKIYLDQLGVVSKNYKDAAAATANVVAPADARSYHIAILNAMQEFATTLDVMIANANDPISSAVLLQNYNHAESDMLNSFRALVTYEKSKHA
jgi:hypothetical protein